MRRRWIAALTMALVAGLLGSAVAHAASGGVSVSATINGQDIAGASAAKPVRLDPDTLSNVVLDVVNHGKEAVVVKRVELSGDVLGLNFYRYVASTELTVQPGATGTLSYQVDLTDLDNRATGLIRAELKVSGDAGRVITTIPTVTDVRGSPSSDSGLFGLALIVLTALVSFSTARAVTRHRLPYDRGRRGLRFVLPGIGIGLVLGVVGSVLRLWAPTTPVWVATAVILAIVFFAIGYFCPMPGDVDYDEDLDAEYEDYVDGPSHHQSTDDVADAADRDALTIGSTGW
jgi:hypothetical protein